MYIRRKQSWKYCSAFFARRHVPAETAIYRHQRHPIDFTSSPPAINPPSQHLCLHVLLEQRLYAHNSLSFTTYHCECPCHPGPCTALIPINDTCIVPEPFPKEQDPNWLVTAFPIAHEYSCAARKKCLRLQVVQNEESAPCCFRKRLEKRRTL
jgi:hypothetical protein